MSTILSTEVFYQLTVGIGARKRCQNLAFQYAFEGINIHTHDIYVINTHIPFIFSLYYEKLCLMKLDIQQIQQTHMLDDG